MPEIGLYYYTLGITVGIWMILVMGQNIITGYAGQISLGHAAFFGVGAYASAVLSTAHGVVFWLALPASVLITSVVGALLGSVSLRLRHDFLAITTIGINFVVVSVFLYSESFGGSLGIGGIPLPRAMGVVFTKPLYLGLVMAALGLAAAADRLLKRSWLGLSLEAIREEETAAAAAGLHVSALKITAFALGTGYAGLAGSLYAHFMTFISPHDFGFPVSITILCMAVLGGLGTLRGALVGALLLGLAPELFRFLRDYRMLTYGALLVLLMRYLPSGLLGDASPLWQRLITRTRGVVRGGVAYGGAVDPPGL
ncbi:MAG: branched-chain amino acid ABC transporter permease [Armatimonadota bacterium]|nr:branched-chain amino acid ABC transporter permease [Armatimonadota bacterium]MDR7548573.1 branched-chain amino acid ABC transporter permease [Armatimonadota bacterium]